MRCTAAYAAVLAALFALPVAAESAALPWRVDLSGAYSKLSGGRDSWTDASLALTYQPNAKTWLTLSGETSRRYGISDRVYGVRAAHVWEGGWSAYAAFDLGPDAAFRARSKLQAGFRSAPLGGGSDGGLIAGADLSYANYAAGAVTSLEPYLAYDNGHGFVATGKLIVARDSADKTTAGYSLKAEFETGRFNLFAGYADAPETDFGVVSDTRTFFGGVTIALSEQTGIRLAYAHEKRDSFDRDEVSTGLTLRY